LTSLIIPSQCSINDRPKIVTKLGFAGSDVSLFWTKMPFAVGWMKLEQEETKDQ